MKKYCLTLDLRNDETLIEEYEAYHKTVWPEVVQAIRDSGIHGMEIFRFGNRLFMIMETEDTFSFERKAAMDAGNAKNREWEELMWKFQASVPGAKDGEKWVLMNCIFDLKEQKGLS